MKAATLGWLVILGSVIFWLLGIEKEIGHMAHLGGGIAGFLICTYYKQRGVLRDLLIIPPPIP
jgi:membrane associated rhomboid family serine protease